MPRNAFWETEKRRLKQATRATRQDQPGAPEELGAVLARIGAAARAVGDRRLARRARGLARGVSRVLAFDADRAMLARVARLGLISPETAAGLEARWEERARARRESLRGDAARGATRALRHALSRRARKSNRALDSRLDEAARRDVEKLWPARGAKADRDLSRYRKLCRRSRELALARAASGVPSEAAEADQAAELALERWHAARRFERRLGRERKDAEVRGSVVLASEIDRLLAALEGAVAGARRLALEEVTRATANVVSFERRSA